MHRSECALHLCSSQVEIKDDPSPYSEKNALIYPTAPLILTVEKADHQLFTTY